MLVTAREMEDSGWHGWMIPKTNGHVRLRQPPLAYWATAASYKVLGVASYRCALYASTRSFPKPGPISW